MEEAYRWIQTKHICPHCDCPQEAEGEPFQEWKCMSCGKTYILGDC